MKDYTLYINGDLKYTQVPNDLIDNEILLNLLMCYAEIMKQMFIRQLSAENKDILFQIRRRTCDYKNHFIINLTFLHL